MDIDILAPNLQKLRKNMIDIHGSVAEKWLANLPSLLEHYQKQWNIQLLEPAANLSYNLVYYAQDLSDNSEVIFKAGIPNPDIDNEIRTLEYFDGYGCVELIKHDIAKGVMLLERAVPGAMLNTFTLQGADNQAVYACVDIISQLHIPAVITPELRKIPKLSDRLHEFKLVRDLIDGNNQYNSFNLEIFNRAEQIFADLCATTTESVVLHGDLHHYNILSARRNPWLAIDPKGLIGDPVFELAAFMINPYPQLAELDNLPELLMDRVEIFHDLLGYEHKRILGWSLAHAFLVAGQNLTSHAADWEESVAIGNILLGLYTQ